MYLFLAALGELFLFSGDLFLGLLLLAGDLLGGVLRLAAKGARASCLSRVNCTVTACPSICPVEQCNR